MPAAFKDYYTTLGVARDASDADLKKAFRKLARKHHPDVAADKATAEEKFKEINEAYEVLGDPQKRKKYDLLGEGWRGDEAAHDPQPRSRPGARRAGAGGSSSADQEFHFGGTGFSDFFEQYFSGGTRYGFPGQEDDDPGRAQARQGPMPARRGSDVEGDILVSLEEAMHGTVRPISLQTVNRQTGQAETQEFQVRIPPGATDGRRIRVPGHGAPGQGGGAAGDLFLRVRHAAHPDFSSQEADILHELDIAPWEAVLGAEIVVPTLDGAIKLRIPPGAENGQKLRVRGRGLPVGKTGERGDFYVVLAVHLPSAISDDERQLWEKLRDTSNFQPRKTPAA